MKIAASIFCLVISVSTKAQISKPQESMSGTTVGKVSSLGTSVAELIYYVSGRDTSYSLIYQNKKVPKVIEYRSLRFVETGGVKETLYTYLKSVFTKENKRNKQYNIKFTLGRNEIFVRHFVNLGGVAAKIYEDGNFFYLNENQVDKLFGK